MRLSDNTQLALDTIHLKPTKGIPSRALNVMNHEHIDRIAGVPPGTYRKSPEETYVKFQQGAGTCLLDQYIPKNALTMGSRGYENRTPGATTGAKEIIVDEVLIDSPEAVVQHLESIAFPRLQSNAAEYDEETRTKQIIENENAIQNALGSDILKSGYGFINFPRLAYSTYGYENYFMAFALYPEVMEKHFSLQADLAVLNNRAAARAFAEGNLPPLYRLDHDMADGRGTLVRINALDEIWFPHFARALDPVLKTNVRMIWHCDGNLMEMVPRLIEVGIKGFQGFQYEFGMDYEKICRMKTKDGEGLIIQAGVSVTRTLPHGSPEDVRRELEWLVEAGPRTGLFLGASSSVTPDTPWENLITLIEGLKYYQSHGRK